MLAAIEKFLEQFNDFRIRLEEQKKKVNIKQAELEEEKDKLDKLKVIRQVLRSLKLSSTEKNPGREGPTIYFAKEITPDNILTAANPTLYEICPGCGFSQPVLIWYEQTFDSNPNGLWEKWAFIMCKKDGVHYLTHFTNGYRF
ncbi:MAG: hypothetical protein HYS32_04370 [Candidatus Woesearchaeota archaeon]|nr:MAG: hypothetical protein HYS32_04370 [Candidatus Woesearchaeota archaeon]